ncbi:hypothetical protein AALK14_01030 [Butyricimonas hominis]|uniref:hypothetical protein n=1 Tax=Butyricimonas TaxID=574697 RepID=UPI0026DD7945|nr:hypothetical protein [uncultured Butyricimonas sp.]
MKKVILFFSFYCFISVLHAQEFWITQGGYYLTPDNVLVYIWDLKIKNEPEQLLRYIRSLHESDKTSNFSENRKKWIEKVKDKISTKEIERRLKDSVLLSKDFFIEVSFDKEGKVFTVGFTISKPIYELLPEKWLKETFSRLMKEKVKASDFFDFSSRPERIGQITFSVTDLITGRFREEKEYYKEQYERKPKDSFAFPWLGTGVIKNINE